MSKRFRLAVVNSHPIQYFAPLYRRIAETDDIDITVYYCSRQGLEQGFVDPGFGKEVVWDIPLLDGYRHRFLRNLRGDRGVGGFLSLLNPGIVRELWRERYDALLVHGHGHATNLLAIAAAKLSGTRAFMRGETHLGLRRHPMKRALRRPVMSSFYRIVDACLYIGTANREFYAAHDVPDGKLFFVPYTVDNERFARSAAAANERAQALRRDLGLAADVPVVLYASKLTARKRPRDMLLAQQRLAREGVQTALLIVGDGEQREALMREAASLALPRTFFAGFVNQNELPAYLALAEAFVLPSEDEPWGLIINEALACGVPVVTTDAVGAAADLIREGRTGYTYPAGDIGALSTALRRIVDGETGAMRTACRERMESWSYEEDIDGIREALAATSRKACTR